ncbi:MAG TPA: hypothetical protein VLI90_14685 [Tepidisphaeraceae bacterium]|nr:hypothetical protein [Tepidisphaeraceae bacterium]
MNSRGWKCWAALAGAAVAPVVSSFIATPLWAAPTLSFTDEGVAHDLFGDTAVGYTGWLLTVTADPGHTMDAVDLGPNTASKFGIFGSLLQDWVPGKKFTTPTPVLADQNGGAYGIDTHVLGAGLVSLIGTPVEDNNRLVPAGSGLNNDPSDAFGTGSYLRANITFNAPATGSVPLAYLVLPSGASPVYSMEIHEDGGVFDLQSIIPPPITPAHNIVWRNNYPGGEPSSYGTNYQFTFITHNDNGTYSPGLLNLPPIGGQYPSEFYMVGHGFSASNPQEVWALNLKVNGVDPTAAQALQIVNDINHDNVGVTATLVSGAYAGLFPGYDVLLYSSGNGTDEWLAIDFSRETSVSGVTVANVAVTVPEPTAIAPIVIATALAAVARRDRKSSDA